jgi:hypothetical protein
MSHDLDVPIAAGSGTPESWLRLRCIVISVLIRCQRVGSRMVAIFLGSL